MTHKNWAVLSGMVLFCLSALAYSEQITPAAAADLMEECQAQREQNIAPLREQAVEDCIVKKRRDRDYCESYNRTFGERRGIGGGRTVPGMFWDLPVCEKAVAAEKYFKMNPGSRAYKTP